MLLFDNVIQFHFAIAIIAVDMGAFLVTRSWTVSSAICFIHQSLFPTMDGTSLAYF